MVDFLFFLGTLCFIHAFHREGKRGPGTAVSHVNYSYETVASGSRAAGSFAWVCGDEIWFGVAGNALYTKRDYTRVKGRRHGVEERSTHSSTSLLSHMYILTAHCILDFCLC